MGSVMRDRDLADVYDETYATGFDPAVLDPVVDVLEVLAQGGPALEFAVGTGRVALRLAERGIAVHGVELSPPMAERLGAKPGADAVSVTIGDMTTTRVPGTFTLVYLVANAARGCSGWTPTTSGARRSTTRSGRSLRRTTGCTCAGVWFVIPRPTATCGPPS